MKLYSDKVIQYYRNRYPTGTRVRLLEMDDPQAPPLGTLGTVIGIDDMANIIMEWDNGSKLNVILGTDHIEIVGENHD